MSWGRAKQTWIVFVLGASALLAAGATCTDDQVTACQNDPLCIVVTPDDPADLRIGDELQRAWNQLVFADPGNPPPYVGLTMPAHTNDWVIEKRVRLCLSDTPPADMDEPPVCDGPGFTGTIAFGGQFDYLCRFDGAIDEIPALTSGLLVNDACLWIGNASNGAVAPPTPATAPTLVGAISATAGQEHSISGYLVLGVAPLFCDGCGHYDDLVVTHQIDPSLPDVIPGVPLPGLAFVGGSGGLSVFQSPPSPTGLALGGVRLDGEHAGTTLHGITRGLTAGPCTYEGQGYDCDLVLAEDLTVHDTVWIRDGGTITSDATILLDAEANKPAVAIGKNQFTSSDPIGVVDIGGRLVKGELAFNGCIRINSQATWRAGGFLTVSASCENRFGLAAPPNEPATHLSFQTGLVTCAPAAAIQAVTPRRIRIEGDAHYETGIDAALDWAHMLRPTPLCSIEGDDDPATGNQIEEVASPPAQTPSTAGVVQAMGTVTDATNGNYDHWRVHPTVTLTGDLSSVLPGDRLIFLGDPASLGPVAGTSRPVLAVNGSVVTLGDWRLDPAATPRGSMDVDALPSGVVGLDYLVERPACFDFANQVWADCASPDTRIDPAGSAYATEGRVALTGGGPDGDVACSLTWVRGGPTNPGDQIGAEIHFGSAETERPSFRVGGDASWNVSADLGVGGAQEARLLGDGIPDDEWIQLQLTSGPEVACRDAGEPGVTCGCFGGRGLGVQEVGLTLILEDAHVCSGYEDPTTECNWGGPGGF